MSYQITYGNGLGKPVRKSGWRFLAAILVLALAILARFTFPEEVKQLTDALFPLTSDSSKEALETFSQHIREGEPLEDAVTALCLEILNDADIS